MSKATFKTIELVQKGSHHLLPLLLDFSFFSLIVRQHTYLMIINDNRSRKSSFFFLKKQFSLFSFFNTVIRMRTLMRAYSQVSLLLFYFSCNFPQFRRIVAVTNQAKPNVFKYLFDMAFYCATTGILINCLFRCPCSLNFHSHLTMCFFLCVVSLFSFLWLRFLSKIESEEKLWSDTRFISVLIPYIHA